MGQVRENLPYPVVAAVEPLGVFRRELLQSAVGTYIVLGQVWPYLPKRLCGRDIGDALSALVFVEGGDLGDHADYQAGHLVHNGGAAKPVGQVVRGGQLEMHPSAVGGWQQVPRYGETEVASCRGLGGKTERADRMTPATGRRAQPQRRRALDAATQPDHGHVVVLWRAPRLRLHRSLNLRGTGRMREHELHRVTRSGTGLEHDMRAGDDNVLHDQEPSPGYLSVRYQDLDDGSEQSRCAAADRTHAVHPITPGFPLRQDRASAKSSSP